MHCKVIIFQKFLSLSIFLLSNNKGLSARHEVACSEDDTVPQRLWALHSVGAKRCPPDTFGCRDGCIAGGSFDGLPPKDPTIVLPSQQAREIIDALITSVATNSQGIKYFFYDRTRFSSNYLSKRTEFDSCVWMVVVFAASYLCKCCWLSKSL